MTQGGTRAAVTVTGVVQGVGFRPFIYRTAAEFDLDGWVRNRGDAGVSIVLEGEDTAIEGFLEMVRTDPPPLSRVESITVEWGQPEGLGSFEIRESTGGEESAGTIPPDTGICPACLEDIQDSESRYHGYWATSCVDCGPRYTVIRGLPYDRPRTSMDAYPMCEDCRAEYEDPADRRYHAQTIACPECGPQLYFEPDQDSRTASGNVAIDRTVEGLQEGKVLAVKGIGGTHLVCDATNPEAVGRLRDRSGRPSKPFALMAPSVSRIQEFATVTDAEESQLEDVRRPIVLLEKGEPPWLGLVAPNLHTVGVMLPYAGLHHLLFEDIEDPLVVTSGNLPGQPMATTAEAVWEDVGDVIDSAVVHDREIVARTDDSVIRVVDGTPRFLRRSRGWVPQPLPRLADEEEADENRDLPTVLAVGPEFDATVALTRDTEVFPSQHIGDVDGPETRAFHRETVEHLTGLLGVDPEVVARDMHPDFVTTDEANRLAAEGLEGPVPVQHHHAHGASLLGEHERERAIIVVADGTGYGPDGTIWGGEVLDVTRADFDRVGSLSTFALPGGSAAVRRPARILASLLDDPERIDRLLVDRAGVDTRDEAAILREQVSSGINTPETTSAGRFLDAISALLDAGTRRDYEGEPAMRLEALASSGTPVAISPQFEGVEGRRKLDVSALTRQLADLAETTPAADIAATAQSVLARGLARIAVRAAKEATLEMVGFSGGVAYNQAISRTIAETVRSEGLEYLDHEAVPPGDAGISYGQALVATARYRD